MDVETSFSFWIYIYTFEKDLSTTILQNLPTNLLMRHWRALVLSLLPSKHFSKNPITLLVFFTNRTPTLLLLKGIIISIHFALPPNIPRGSHTMKTLLGGHLYLSSTLLLKCPRCEKKKFLNFKDRGSSHQDLQR